MKPTVTFFVVVIFVLLNAIVITAASSDSDDVKIRIIPSIISIPNPVTYWDRKKPGPQLACEFWPPNANISFFIAHPSTNRNPLSLDPITFSPSNVFSVSYYASLPLNASVDNKIPASSNGVTSLMISEGGDRKAENSEFWQIDSVDVHCRATTMFGSVLSAPFRVVQAKLPEFPTSSSKVRVQEFINGNVGFISCRIPPDSQPPPTVQFFLNGTLITNSRIGGKEKYKIVHRPNEDQVILLISRLKTSDEGDYRCQLTNPVTGGNIWSPEIVRLQVRTPDKPVPVRALLNLAPQDNSSAAASRQILVREGDNVTLICIMEGAPPPVVRTYLHNTQNNRHIMDENFGLLPLSNVQLSDEGVYLCSTDHQSLSATLVVKPRLRFSQSPHDVRVNLGERAEFRCSASEPSVLPFWLFNGEPIHARNPKFLVIDSVKEGDLGLYQCIARTLTADGRTDEWISATALLTLYSDKVVTKAADLVDFIPSAHRTPSHKEEMATTKEMTPLVEMALDNFAVYLTWNVSDATLFSGFHSDGSRLDLASSTLQQNIAFLIDYSSLLRQSVLNPALVGLVPPEPAVWSKAERLDKVWKDRYGFVIGSPLEPGKTYRFRVRAIALENGLDVIPPSDWSEPVSTHHISNATPPRITSVQPYHDGRFNVTWEYDGDGNNRLSNTEVFKPDFFLVLIRPVLRNLPQSSSQLTSSGSDIDATNAAPGELATKNDAVVRYGRYRATQVNGSDAREAFIYNLNTSISYQLVVYGVKYENGARRITRFSEAKFATLPEVPSFGTFSLIRTVTENKPIFIGLGALALIIFLVVLVLVILCIARQRKYRRRRRVKHNGFLTGHTESEKYQTQSQQQQHGQQQERHSSTDLRTSSPSAKAAQAQGQAMLMGTLMRQSNFSEPPSQQQQFAQQQAAYMGSAMHLGYYGNHHPQHHHQSHHSLLLPATAGSGIMGSPIFHSGTLPPGMRSGGMLHQHHHIQSPPPPPPPPPPGHLGGFGSQQVLNQMDGIEQATLLRDYYQQQQQQQQQLYQHHLLSQQHSGQQASFMQYAANNSAGYLSPQQQQQQMIDTLSSRQHGQGFPYGGSIHSAASLKRDPNGSMHEEGTLLARSPMSPHPPPMLGEQIPPPGYFQSPLFPQQHPIMSPPPPPPVQMSAAAYYPGQPQADPTQMTLHNMGHHTDGESIYSYFSQQDVCHSQPHALLNPLPEENQMNLGYAESGSQTAGLNGNSGTASPPAGGTVGAHRHHRRRRRKQQQQQSQSPGQQFAGGGEGDGFQFPGHNNEQIALMTMMETQGRIAPSGMNGTSPPSAAGLEQTNGNEVLGQLENQRSGNQSFDRSTPSYGASPGVGLRSPLPPPSQPPPPPPAMMMMPMQMTSSGGLDNPGIAIGNPNAAGGSSLNRRGGVSGVLSGAPPRIRDYSEYGIPTSVPATGGISNPPPQGAVTIATTASASGKQIPASQGANFGTNSSGGVGGNMRYREGQA